jgi:hypothetical protein
MIEGERKEFRRPKSPTHTSESVCRSFKRCGDLAPIALSLIDVIPSGPSNLTSKQALKGSMLHWNVYLSHPAVFVQAKLVEAFASEEAEASAFCT